MSEVPDFELQRVQSTLQAHRTQLGRRRIPDSIRQQTLSLLSLYPRKHVVNTLGISYKMLCRWEQEAQGPDTPPETETVAFVELPMDTGSACNRVGDLPAIELWLADEVRLTFNGSRVVAHCLPLLQGLGYGRSVSVLSPLPMRSL